MNKICIYFVLLFTVFMIQPYGCTLVDSGEVGVQFHKWSSNENDYGGVEGTCKGWVWYNTYTTSVETYPIYIQRKNYEAFNVNARMHRFSLWTQRLPIVSTRRRFATSLSSIVRM